MNPPFNLLRDGDTGERLQLENLSPNPTGLLLALLNIRSMLSNFFASSGSCDLMSPPMKMLSRYIHLRWTTIQI